MNRSHLGHNPLGAVMVVALLGLLGVIALTGTMVYLGPESFRREEELARARMNAR